MGEGAVLWIKVVIPLVVHPASKVRLRAAAALEMGMPLLLEKQQEVAAIIEPMMSSVSLSLLFHFAETLQEREVLVCLLLTSFALGATLACYEYLGDCYFILLLIKKKKYHYL